MRQQRVSQSLHSISETSKKVRSPVKMLFKSSLMKLKDKKVADGRAELMHSQTLVKESCRCSH